jgi:hypothetical protein
LSGALAGRPADGDGHHDITRPSLGLGALVPVGPVPTGATDSESANRKSVSTGFTSDMRAWVTRRLHQNGSLNANQQRSVARRFGVVPAAAVYSRCTTRRQARREPIACQSISHPVTSCGLNFRPIQKHIFPFATELTSLSFVAQKCFKDKDRQSMAIHCMRHRIHDHKTGHKHGQQSRTSR